VTAQDWNFGAPKAENQTAADQHGQRKDEEKTTIILHDQAELRQVRPNSAQHRDVCQSSAIDCSSGDEQHDPGDQFHNSSSDSSPWFNAKGRKDEFGFGRTGGFKEERLKQNPSDQDLKKPTHILFN